MYFCLIGGHSIIVSLALRVTPAMDNGAIVDGSRKRDGVQVPRPPTSHTRHLWKWRMFNEV